MSVFKDPNNIKLPQRLFQIISVFSNVFVVQFPNVDIRGLREVTLEQGPITSSSVAKICGQKRGKSSSGKKRREQKLTNALQFLPRDTIGWEETRTE